MLQAESGQESPCSALKEDWKDYFWADECLLEGVCVGTQRASL